MKFKFFITFLGIFFSTNLLACTVPFVGEEFNNLIKVKWNEKSNRFLITFPIEVNGQEFYEIFLNIANSGNEPTGASARLKSSPKNGKLFSYVSLSSYSKLNSSLSVKVWWVGLHDLCPIIGVAKLTPSRIN